MPAVQGACAKSINVLLPTLGSAGDVNPFIALGRAMQARGHRVTVMTNPLFQPLVEQQGLHFLAVGSEQVALAAIANPDVWHLRKGIGVIAPVIAPAIEEIYRLIEKHADGHTVVAFSTLAFGARVAQEKLGVPSASIHLQPSVLRTLGDQGMLGNVRLSAAHPRWLKAVLFGLIDWLIIDRHLKQPLNECRARLGLPPIARPMHRWMHSPQLVIGFFPEWFAAAQPDWPPHCHAIGFPLWDDLGEYPRAAEEFLNAGPAPVIFTPGSAASTMHRFFDESVQAVRRLNLRAMLVTNFPQQVPRNLPPGVEVFGYLPFSRLLPRAALLVYHGGVGTLAQAIKAAVPQLVVPNGYDQFDSAWRVEQLRLGRSIPQTRYRADLVAGTISAMLNDGSSALRREDCAARIDSAATLTRACELLEALAE